MEGFLNVLAKVLESVAHFTSASTSIIIIYQPEKPECLKKDENK